MCKHGRINPALKSTLEQYQQILRQQVMQRHVNSCMIKTFAAVCQQQQGSQSGSADTKAEEEGDLKMPADEVGRGEVGMGGATGAMEMDGGGGADDKEMEVDEQESDSAKAGGEGGEAGEVDRILKDCYARDGIAFNDDAIDIDFDQPTAI